MITKPNNKLTGRAIALSGWATGYAAFSGCVPLFTHDYLFD